MNKNGSCCCAVFSLFFFFFFLLFIHSFIHSFIHLFIHSFIHSFKIAATYENCLVVDYDCLRLGRGPVSSSAVWEPFRSSFCIAIHEDPSSSRLQLSNIRSRVGLLHLALQPLMPLLDQGALVAVAMQYIICHRSYFRIHWIDAAIHNF